MPRESTIGSTFRLEVIPTSAPTAVVISSATKANPTVLTTVAAAVAVGDMLRVKSTGFAVLDRMTPHRVKAFTGATSVTLDTDNSKSTETGVAGSFIKLNFVDVCFAEFGLDIPAPGEVDVTTMCDLERRNVAGLKSQGTATFGGPLDMDNAGIQALIAAQNDGLPRALIWTTRSGQQGLMYGVVTSFAGGPQGVEQAVSYSGTFQVQDIVVYLPKVA